MVRMCKANIVRAILTNTHAPHQEESERFETMFAFKVERETAGNFFNSLDRTDDIDGMKKFANGTKMGQVKHS